MVKGKVMTISEKEFGILQGKFDILLEKVDERFDSVERRLDKFESMVLGNGTPGLRENVNLNSVQIDALTKQAERISKRVDDLVTAISDVKTIAIGHMTDPKSHNLRDMTIHQTGGVSKFLSIIVGLLAFLTFWVIVVHSLLPRDVGLWEMILKWLGL